MAKNNRKKRNPDDKILDNSYNKGEIDYSEFGKIEVDKKYASNNLTDSYDSYNYYRYNKLTEELFEIYKISKWFKPFKEGKSNSSLKPSKRDLPTIYVEIRESFEKDSKEVYTESEFFTALSDVLNISYSILWEMLPSGFKVKIYEELQKKYKKVNKEDYYQLF